MPKHRHPSPEPEEPYPGKPPHTPAAHCIRKGMQAQGQMQGPNARAPHP